MKKIKYYLILLFTIGSLISALMSCEKVQQGFLTDYPYYDQDPMYLIKGRSYTSNPLETINSTIPMRVKILHVYDSAGNNVDSIFLKRYPLTIFNAYYDPLVDTTLALIKSITTSVDTFAINVNSANGSFQANYNTNLMPPGAYTFDLQISNSAGTKIYPKIGEFILQEGEPYQKDPELGTTSDVMYQEGNESITHTAAAPIATIQYIPDSTNVVEVKYVDKNGTPFNPANGEIINRPYAPSPTGYLPNLQQAALQPQRTDSSILCNFAMVPFPIHVLEFSFNYYVRIPAKFIKFDNTSDSVGWSGNPRWVGRFWVPGKYEVTIQLPDATHL